MMYTSENPTTALVLARYRLQEDIARAEAYRAAKAARAARRGSRHTGPTGRSGRGLVAALRSVVGRARTAVAS